MDTKKSNTVPPSALKLIKPQGQGRSASPEDEAPKTNLGKFFTGFADAIDADIKRILEP